MMKESFMPFLTVPEIVTDKAYLSNISASIAGYPAVEIPSVRRSQLLELPGMESDNRVKWTQLPEDPLTGVSVGIVVLLPQNPSNLSKKTTSTTQKYTDIVVCNIDAGWGASSINVTAAQAGNSASSSLIKLDGSKLVDTSSSPLYMNRFQALTDSSVVFRSPLHHSIPIEIDVKWAANTTVIDYLLKNMARNGSKAARPETGIRDIISGLMTNGLARSGFTSILRGNMTLTQANESIAVRDGTSFYYVNGRVPDANVWFAGKNNFFTVDPEESKDWVKLRVDSTIQGYAYNIDGPAPKVAIAFLLTYCCFAVGHFIYSGISGIFSFQTSSS